MTSANRSWTAFALLLGLLAIAWASRAFFLTSSLNMWDSPDYAFHVQKVLDDGLRARFDTIELDHPLYAYLVGLLHRCLGLFGMDDVLASCKWFGVIAMVSSLIPLYWLARWLLDSAGAALAVVAVYIVNPLAWWWSSEVMSDTAGVAISLWILATAARFAERGKTRYLVASCLLLGTGVLLRISVLLTVPPFALIVACGLLRPPAAASPQRLRKSLTLLLTPVVPLLFIAAQCAGHGLSPDAFFELTPQNEIRRDLASDPLHWARIGDLLVNALGPIGAALSGLALVAVPVINLRLFVLAAAWAAPVFFVEATNTDTVIRYYLPLMPLAALLFGALLHNGLRRLPHGRDLAAAVFGLAVASMVWHALPNLTTLRDAPSAMDEVGRWYREHAPHNALVVSQGADNHIRYFAKVERVRYHPEVVGKPWEKSKHSPPQTLQQTLSAIAAAIDQGKPVFVSDLAPRDTWLSIVERVALEPVATLGTGPGKIRNTLDPGFARMDDAWRTARPVTIYRVTWSMRGAR